MLSNILELELHSTKHAHTQNEEVQFNDGGSSYIRTAFDLCGHAPNSVLWGGGCCYETIQNASFAFFNVLFFKSPKISCTQPRGTQNCYHSVWSSQHFSIKKKALHIYEIQNWATLHTRGSVLNESYSSIIVRWNASWTKLKRWLTISYRDYY